MINDSKKYFSLENDLTNFFNNNPGRFFSIEELDENLDSIPYNKLKSILENYKNKPVDTKIYLESLCSYLEKRRKLNIKKDSNHYLYGLS